MDKDENLKSDRKFNRMIAILGLVATLSVAFIAFWSDRISDARKDPTAVVITATPGFHEDKSGILKPESEKDISGEPAAAFPLIRRLEIDLMPEYDSPEVLVIYRMTLAETPAHLVFHIPAAVKGTPIVAVEKDDHSLFEVPFNLTHEGQWKVLSFDVKESRIQMEYYDSEIIKSTNLRLYHFLWPGDNPLGSMLVKIQQPAKAKNFITDPLYQGQTGQDGLVYYVEDVGPIPEKDNVQFSFSYQNDTGELSLKPFLPAR